MPTTTVKTIGTGGDYSTVQAWEDACPANLVTNDEIWQGQLKNEEFVVGGGPVLTVSGITTDTTRYIELKCEAGASFVDNVNVRTNALRYNASNGAALRTTFSYGKAIVLSGPRFHMSGVQVKGGGSPSTALDNTTSPVDFDKCIFEGNRGSQSQVLLYGGRMRNCAVIYLGANTSATIASIGNGVSVYNCTFASLAATVTNAISGSYGTPVVQNCAIFGCTTVKTGGNSPTYTTNYTNASSPPSGFTTTAFSTSSGALFENITSGTHDLRIKSGSSLTDTGTTDSTNAANDISGFARSGSWDVGAWEFSAGGGGGGSIAAISNYYRMMGNA